MLWIPAVQRRDHVRDAPCRAEVVDVEILHRYLDVDVLFELHQQLHQREGVQRTLSMMSVSGVGLSMYN